MSDGSHVTLSGDDPLLRTVGNEESVLRRFNPNNPQEADQVTIDEGAVPRIRLRPSALTGFSDDGCSVSRDAILSHVGIPRSELAVPPKYTHIAEASVAAIRGFEHETSGGETLRPFEVVPDPYPDLDSPSRTDVAHALISIAMLTRADRKIAVGRLARTIFNPLHEPVGGA
jgi:hypothetical protein